jgi:tripartite-type tricarboxylate transporter receptor subunit TctC
MAKQVSYAIVALPPALPYLKSGRLRAVAVAGNSRATVLPDVPTIGASVAGYGVSTWIGLLAPYGASVQLVRTVNADIQTIMRRPDLVELLGSLGYEAKASTPGDFQNRLRADIERYSRIVFDAGMSPQ